MLYNLIKIEKEENLWNYEVENILLWPLIRTQLFSYILNKEQKYNQNVHGRGNFSNLLKPTYLCEMKKTMEFPRSNKNKKYDSFFSTNSRYQNYDINNKKYSDSIHSPYYNLYSKPLIFERSYQLKINRPCENESSTYLSDYIYILRRLGQLKRISDIDNKKIRSFLNIVYSKFDLKPEEVDMYRFLISEINGRSYYIPYVEKIISTLSGNIAYIYTGSYLGLWGQIINRFKESGVKIIEVQHGGVSHEHYAYNYPDNISIIKEYLPDYYLTFGKYWNEQINMPSKLITVGNPSFNNTKSKFEENIIPIPKSILVVSQGIITSKMVEITKYLSKKLPKSKIIFKLHPGEVPFIYRYQELKKYDNVSIMTYENIYQLIAACEVIIGYNSTTLFEAAAFKNKRIFIVNNNLVPNTLGYKFLSNKEVLDAISNTGLGYPTQDPNYYWEQDWENKTRHFLQSIE